MIRSGAAAMLAALLWGLALAAPVPAAKPQHPTLFAAFPARPAWKVAGVDYAPGAPAGAKLADPATISMPGVSVNPTAHTITITGPSVILSHYDFSREGGWNVTVSGVNDTLAEDYWLVGANNLVPVQCTPSASGTAVVRSTIDGGGLGVANNPGAIWSLVSCPGKGLTIARDWLKNAPQHVVEVSNSLIERRNLIENLGFAPGAHPNAVQFCGGSASGSEIAYNTIYNPVPVNGYPNMDNEDLQVEGQCTGTVLNTTLANNVVIAAGTQAGTTSSYLIAIRQDPGPNLVQGVKVLSNWLYWGGAWGPLYPLKTPASDVTFSGNMSLKTGTALALP